MNSKELAERLRLSPATVSRVLSGKSTDYRIGPRTQSRVLAAAQQYGVAVDLQARALRLGATHTLGFIAPDISNPFFAEFCRLVEQLARRRGYSVLIADSQEDVEAERDSLRLMQSRNVDGLIIAPVVGRGPHLESLVAGDKPLVLFDRVSQQLQAPGVVLDNVGAARAGVALLAEAGHRQIACLEGATRSVANRGRVSGFRAEMKARGLAVAESWIRGGDCTVEVGAAATRELLALRPRPTAILALGNLLALGAMEALRGAEVGVPDGMSLVSFDEQPWAAALAPPLTTIAQPVAAMAEQAMDLLFRRLGKQPVAESLRVVAPFQVIPRRSVAPPPGSIPRIP